MALDVLIVDDERDIRELVAGVLEDDGYETAPAAASSTSTTSVGAIPGRKGFMALPQRWMLRWLY